MSAATFYARRANIGKIRIFRGFSFFTLSFEKKSSP